MNVRRGFRSGLCILAVVITLVVAEVGSAATGAPDTAFGTSGVVTESTAAELGAASALATYPNGDVVVAGIRRETLGEPPASTVSVRVYGNDGLRKTGFGTGGVALADWGGENDSVAAVTLAPDGKIIVAGSADLGGNDYDIAVLRLNQDGTLDQTFGTSGVATAAISSGIDQGFDVKIDGNGRVVIAGRARKAGDEGFDLAVVRFTSAGVLDPSFSDDGIVRTEISGASSGAWGIAIQRDNKPVIAGGSSTSTPTNTLLEGLVVRYQVDGTLDTGFAGGVVRRGNFLSEVAIQQSGRILAFGEAEGDLGVYALAATGASDTGFGGDGTVTFGLREVNNAVAAGLDTEDGLVLASSGYDADFVTKSHVSRLGPNGAPDTSFGADGSIALADASSVFDLAVDDLRIIALTRNQSGLIQLTAFQNGPELFCDGKLVTVSIARGQQPTNGNDVIVGTANNDEISAGGGDDVVCGGGGDDIIEGGGGKDILFGEEGLDLIDGGPGDDTLDGGAGNDVVLGGSGKDAITGGRGDDAIFGQRGSDTLTGGKGSDSINGGSGADNISGGSGNDRMRGKGGADKIRGGRGNDILLGQTGNDDLRDGRGSNVCDGGSGRNFVDCEVSLCGKKDVTVDLSLGQRPTDGDDVILGTEGADDIDAGRGDDWVCGLGGDDVVRGGPGADRIDGGRGNDRILGESGEDFLGGGPGRDTIFGGPASDWIFGGAGKDELVGDGGGDAMSGGKGDDLVYGSAGWDVMSGGKGDDTLYGGPGNDAIIGGPGLDAMFGEEGDDDISDRSGSNECSGGPGKDKVDCPQR